MTAASQGPQLFSIFSLQDEFSNRTRRKTFVLSLAGEALLLAMTVYVTCCIFSDTPELARRIPKFNELPLIFSGHGGGGGLFDPLPASRGNPPRASLATQIVPPTVIVPKEMPRLPVEATVEIPEVNYPQAGPIGDPNSPYSRWLPNGPGGPNGIGTGCCGGVGPGTGPGVGPGPSGILSPGKMGVTVPQVIYNPEPNFSDGARQTKTQGRVTLILVVGKDGHPYDIRVGQSLGMGLDERAIDAVSRWRFRPATLNGQPVATQIAVEVTFRLY